MKNTETTEKRPDRRVIKTKRAIRNAFVELLAGKELNDITIKDIADVADVNRKTVYNYYGGVHEILDEIENELVSSFERVMQDADIRSNLENPYRIFEMLTELINRDMEFCSRLMKIDANSHLVRKIISALKVRVGQIVSEQIGDSRKAELISDFVSSGMLSAYQGWFNSGREQPIEEFSKNVGRLVFYGVNGLIGD